MAKKINFRKNERKKYQQMVVIIVGVFLLFFGSRLFIKPEVDIKTSKIGEEVFLDMRTITLIKRNYYPTDDVFTFSFYSPVNSTNVLDELSVSVKKNRTDTDKYDIDLKQINEELYVVTIKNLPTNWEKLDVAIYPKTSKVDSLNDSQKFHFGKKDVTTSEPYNSAKTKDSYELEAVKFEIDTTDKKLQKNTQKEKTCQQEIKKIRKINKGLSATLGEKTTKEKEELKLTIGQNNSKIQSIEKEISTLKEQDKELELKLEKLTNRKQELQNL